MKKQTSLQYGREPLQIPVPADFSGQRSSDESEIFLSTTPCLLTQDEIDLVQDYIQTLPYKQALVFGAVFIDVDDPLLTLSHEKLSEIEQSMGYVKSRYVKSGGQRSIYERVLLIREQGYKANGFKQLSGVS